MLESVKKEEYGDAYDSAVLEQWKTCAELANAITEKRNSANMTFITLNTAILAVNSFSAVV